jgi:hypothetical protein
VEDARQANRLARFDAEGDDVLDLEVDRVPDPDAVAKPLLDDHDRRTLDPEDFADQRGQKLNRATLLPAVDRGELLDLVVRRILVNEHAEPPIALGHDLRRVGDHGDRAAAHVRASGATSRRSGNGLRSLLRGYRLLSLRPGG